MLSPGDFVPDIELPAAGGRRLQLRVAATTVLVTVHSPGCEDCRKYIDALDASRAEFADWDARLVIIMPGPAAAPVTTPFGTVVIDPENRIADGRSASVVVADRYGQVFHAAHAGASHVLPGPRELEEWLKYLGTLCPE